MIYTLLLSCGFYSSLICAHPIYNPTTTSTTEIQDKPRAILVANVGNYSLSFVPLISVLANILPRLVTRVKGVSQSKQAVDYRSQDDGFHGQPLWERLNGFIPCSDYKLGRWSFPGNSCMFYQCQLPPEAPQFCKLRVTNDSKSAAQMNLMSVSKDYKQVTVDSCVMFQIHKCNKGYIFNNEDKNCEKAKPDRQNVCLTKV